MLESKHVVLVDEQDNVLGTEDKLEAHNSHTSLHRGFSVFLFNSKKKVLIQKRSSNKKTWPSFWSNSFCGHPQITETYEQGIHRQSQFELAIKLQQLYYVSNYRYKFTMKTHNIMENEICPIYLAISDDVIIINKDEIEEVQLFEWSDFILYSTKYPDNFTPWCQEEAYLLQESDIFKKFMDITL